MNDELIILKAFKLLDQVTITKEWQGDLHGLPAKQECLVPDGWSGEVAEFLVEVQKRWLT